MSADQLSRSDSVLQGDMILPFQLDLLDMRGRVVRLDATIDTILNQHAYPDAVSGVLAEAALLTTLIGGALKLKSRFSLQVRGEGPLRLIATDFFAPEEGGSPARLRAYAGFDADALGTRQADGFSLIGNGVMGLTIDQGVGMTPYQGITPITGDSLSESTEVYFAQSEQIATRFTLSTARTSSPGGKEEWRAGGIMVQHLPPASPLMPDKESGGRAAEGEANLMRAEDVAALDDAEDIWAAATLKLSTVEEHELIGPHVSPEELLIRLFHEDAPRVYEAQPVAFGCTCSREKVETVIKGHDKEDLATMRNADGVIIADCQFCSRQYRFE